MQSDNQSSTVITANPHLFLTVHLLFLDLILIAAASGVFFGLMLRYGFDILLFIAEIIILGLLAVSLWFTRKVLTARAFIVSAYNLEYRDTLGTLTISTSWDNIERIDLTPNAVSYSLSLILRQPVQVITKYPSTFMCSSIPLHTSLINRARLFTWIKSYAPQLFSPEAFA